ncbi:hypothetical protein [Acidimangrovimonas sediminis]|uniref:hypothetical protein n=1 Tax=Acidimangrovimonas sediminis TaxID=2056283 RepID=UPI000C808F42|nr:hypothetical protein [Acidimangrovimonas sediminis]
MASQYPQTRTQVPAENPQKSTGARPVSGAPTPETEEQDPREMPPLLRPASARAEVTYRDWAAI